MGRWPMASVGSWEAFCAGPALARTAQQLYPERLGDATTPEVVTLALAGDADAIEVVRADGR